MTSHIIVMDTDTNTAPMNISKSLVLSDIVNRFKLMYISSALSYNSVM
jgi:hypothetical protein